jgi:hypothetical protein
MTWTILFDPDFAQWLDAQSPGVQVAIAAHTSLLSQRGPALGRPYVDTLKGSPLPNLKELRVQQGGTPWRILFAFDPQRQAILLVGGSKQGNARWYREMIPIAEQRYQRHIATLED